MSSRSLCSSVLVSSHSASLSSFSRKYDILKSGKSLWKQLADQDQSFIVTFYESHVLLSFNISPGPGSVESGKLWVRVAFLGPQERPKGSRDDQSIILLDDIQEDHDVTIKYESRTILYVCWKQEVVSIQYRDDKGHASSSPSCSSFIS